MKKTIHLVFLSVLLHFLIIKSIFGFQSHVENGRVLRQKFDSIFVKAESLLKNNYDSAFSLSKDALLLARQMRDSALVVDVLGIQSMALSYKGNFEQSIETIKNALVIVDSAARPLVLANLYNNMGKNYKSLQKNRLAMDYYLRSLKIRQNENDTTEMIGSLINIGSLNSSMKKDEISLQYYLAAFELAKLKPNDKLLGIINNNIAIRYKSLGDFNSALSHYRMALQYYEKMKWDYGQAYALGNLGVLQESLDNTGDSALFYYQKALAIHKHIKDQYGVSVTKINMALIYNNQRKFVLAKKLFFQSIEIAKQINSSRLLEYAYEGLADLERLNGNYKKAFEYYKLNREIVDSVYNAETHKQIAELETKYQTEKKSREIEVLSKNAEIQDLQLIEKQKDVKNAGLIIIALALLFLLGMLLAYFLWKHNKIKHLNDKNMLEIKNLRIEQKMLKAQMNPHFVFNALNSIQAYITSNQSELASKYLASFAKLMRGFLDNARTDQVRLDKEIELLKTYIELEQVRFEHKFEFRIKIDEDVEEEFVSIPPLVIQPFVENAILHAFRNRDEGLIELRFRATGDYLICEIDDNGIGREAAQKMKTNQKRESLALKITERRLESVNEQFNVDSGFTIIDKKDPDTDKSLGTKVIVKLPILE